MQRIYYSYLQVASKDKVKVHDDLTAAGFLLVVNLRQMLRNFLVKTVEIKLIHEELEISR